VLATEVLGFIAAQISNNQDPIALLMGYFGIPLTSSVSAGFAVGFMKG
jgi:hypothetical protein